MEKLYVIIGHTGEYSDRTEWLVAAVSLEEEAKAYVEALMKQYQQIPPSWLANRWHNEEKIAAKMTLDPYFSNDYTGTYYTYEAVDYFNSDSAARKLKEAA